MNIKNYYISIIGLFLIIIFALINIVFLNGPKYEKLYIKKTNNYLKISEHERGKILDINGKILVDNKGIKAVLYNKENNTIFQEINIAYKLALILDIDEPINIETLKCFWILNNQELSNKLITLKEYELYHKRVLSKEEIYQLKLKRIEYKVISEMDNTTKKAALIYEKMQKGYSYEPKIIKETLTHKEEVEIINANIKGIKINMTWERYYPYGDTLKTILGKVTSSGIPSELINYFKDNNYQLNDRVGISYLELYYDKYLQPKKSVYKIVGNTLKLETKGQKGNDLILNIDIDLTLKVKEIVEKEFLKTKQEKNTAYFDHIYVIISTPETGGIVVPLSLKYTGDVFVDNSYNIITSSYTLGSVIKGASSSVNYLYNLIEKDKLITDSCIKLYLVPKKCSHRPLGRINDVTALAYSSNYYQYLTAIYLTGNKYSPNMELEVNSNHFKIYRDIFASYGLGVLTEIDLPNERIGQIGKKESADLLLNLAIGQYDTYPPIELVQYINSIATGKRTKLSLMNKIVNEEGVIISNNSKELNKIIINKEDLTRINKGFEEVFRIGTAKNHANKLLFPAGKTGTSESFLDSNYDGKIDIETTTTSVAMYFPSNNPQYSLIIISPHLSYNNDGQSYVSNINKRLTKEITNLFLTND